MVCSWIGSFFDFMPGHSPKKSLHQLPAWMIHGRDNFKDQGRLNLFPHQGIFYGGTFWPFHSGHKACIQLALKKMTDCTDFNPNIKTQIFCLFPDQNPHKTNNEELKKSRCPFALWKSLLNELASMMHSTAHSTKKTKLISSYVYPGFLSDDAGANPTVDWLQEVTIKDKILVMGDDQWQQFSRWKNPEVLLEISSQFWIVPRLKSHAELISSPLQDLDQKIPWKKDFDSKIVILEGHGSQGVSSTQLRSLL